MPLSTAAKVTIATLTGTALVGGGIALARRKKAPKMKRDDGSRPDAGERPVASIDFDALYQSSESEGGYPIAVGTRYEIALPKDTAAEFSAGRRIGTLSMAKIVNGEPQLDKAWAVDSDSFEAQHNEMSLAFDLPSKTLTVTADRAGLYLVAMLDRDGNEVLDDMVFLATAGTEDSSSLDGLQPRGSGSVDAGTKHFHDIYEFYATLVVNGPSRAEEILSGRGTFPATVGQTLEVDGVSAEIPLRDARRVSVAKVLETGPLEPSVWSVQGGKLPLGFSVGTDLEVGYLAASDTLRIRANRAGRYRLQFTGADESRLFSAEIDAA